MEVDFTALEKQCDYCKGEGIVGGETCVGCNGNPKVLTEFGERVVDLIDRRIIAQLRQL